MSEQNTLTEDQLNQLAEERAQKLLDEKHGGLVNKRDELLGTNRKLKDQLEKYKSLIGDADDETIQAQLEQARTLHQKMQEDKILAMAANGDVEGLREVLTKQQRQAWEQETGEVKRQFEEAQTYAQKLEQEKQEYASKLSEVQKRQYLKELTSEDDSFRKDYFSDFFSLYANKFQIEESTGTAYALENGEKLVDAQGNFVKFEDYYAKQKVNHGLFWNGGSGSGYKSGLSSGSMDKDPLKWTVEQRQEYIRENGTKAYSDLMKNRSK